MSDEVESFTGICIVDDDVPNLFGVTSLLEWQRMWRCRVWEGGFTGNGGTV